MTTGERLLRQRQLRRVSRAFRSTWRAYFSRPYPLTNDHATQLYHLARMCGHEAIGLDRSLAPGEPVRY